MSQSDESEKPFTVSDRRHFTPEGRPRDDAASTDAPGPPGENEASEPPRGEGERGEREAEPRAGAGAPTAAGATAEFSGFVMGLAAQAGTLLSGQELPEGIDAREALEGARSVIAILEMLKEKTAGNLSGPEASLLDEILFQLRMAYLEKTRTGGA